MGKNTKTDNKKLDELISPKDPFFHLLVASGGSPHSPTCLAAKTPVEVGGFSHYLQGFYTSQMVQDF